MVTLKNYVFGDNDNISVVEEKDCFCVFQHLKDLSVMPSEAERKFYMSQMNATQKQLFITLENTSVKLSAGAMQMMIGNVSMKTGVKGVGDLFGKALKAKATGDSAIKPEYSGVGYVVTEPTYRHILLEELKNWNGAIVCDDGMFLACGGEIRDTVEVRQNMSSALAGGEGLFNLKLVGDGIVALSSPCPRQELVELVIDNDVVKIDGNMAVCWSSSLQFTTEKAGASLVGSAASGEGLVNVYRGSGRILMCPV